MASCRTISVMALALFALIAQAQHSGESELAGTALPRADTPENNTPPVDDGFEEDIAFANSPATTANNESVTTENEGKDTATTENEDDNAPNAEYVDENTTDNGVDTYEFAAADLVTTESTTEELMKSEPQAYKLLNDDKIKEESITEILEKDEVKIRGDSDTDARKVASYSSTNEIERDKLITEDTNALDTVVTDVGDFNTAMVQPDEVVTKEAKAQGEPIDEATGELKALGADTETDTLTLESAGGPSAHSDVSFRVGNFPESVILSAHEYLDQDASSNDKGKDIEKDEGLKLRDLARETQEYEYLVLPSNINEKYDHEPFDINGGSMYAPLLETTESSAIFDDPKLAAVSAKDLKPNNSTAVTDKSVQEFSKAADILTVAVNPNGFQPFSDENREEETTSTRLVVETLSFLDRNSSLPSLIAGTYSNDAVFYDRVDAKQLDRMQKFNSAALFNAPSIVVCLALALATACVIF